MAYHHHHHCIFFFLEDIIQSTVFIQVFLSPKIFSRLSRSFSWSPDRLMSEYLEMSFRIRLSHVAFGLPADLFHGFSKAFSDLLAGVAEDKWSRWPTHVSFFLHIVRLHGVTLVQLYSSSFAITLDHVTWITFLSSLRWKESMDFSSVLVKLYNSEL